MAGYTGRADFADPLGQPARRRGKDFIEDYGVSNIHVLGGTAAVSDDVFEELRALAHKPNVERIFGDNRYATAARIAGQLQGESWCGTNDNSAILASGANDALFDAVAIGPVANRLELPVLLTDGDMLVDEVVSYIDSANIEYVVIVGSTASVTTDVEDALDEAGVDAVERIPGDSPAAVSVAIAEKIVGDCADDLSPVSNNTVALVNSNSVIDGITAAPVLSDDTNQLGGGLIPILAVGDILPASVRDYLAATAAEDAAGLKIHMRVLAVGGTAAVSNSVMDAAVDAAESAPALTVQISGSATNPAAPVHPDADNPAVGDMIWLHFSDDVFRETTESTTGIRNRLEDILEINGVPADIVTGAGEDATCAPDIVPVTLVRDLRPGDKIAIVEGNVLVGAAPDQRIVEPTEITVTTPAADLRRPIIEIVALDGHTELYALAHDPENRLDSSKRMLAGPGSLTDENGESLFDRTAGDVGIQSVAETAPADTNGAARHGGKTLLTFTLGNVAATTAVTETDNIDAGDRFRANRGALLDLGGPWPNTNPPNESQVTTRVAVKPTSQLKVSSVQMSSLNNGTQANQPTVVIPSAHRTETAPTDRNTSDNPGVWLEAKADGAAAGAFGNAWSVRVDKASNWDPNKDIDVRVFVSETDRRIGIRIVDGEPRFADLKAALEANATVNRLFFVRVDNQFNGTVNTCRAANDKLRHADLPNAATDDAGAEDAVNLSGGSTTAAIHVVFNDWVEEITDAQSARLLTHVLADTLKRIQPPGDTPVEEPALRTLLSISATSVFTKPVASGPVKLRRLEIVTQSAHALPMPRDLVDIPDGFDRILSGDNKGDPVDSDTTTVAGVQRQDTDQTSSGGPGETSIANGYGDNGTADGTNGSGSPENDFNYKSENRIVRSSTVNAPTWSAFGG